MADEEELEEEPEQEVEEPTEEVKEIEEKQEEELQAEILESEDNASEEELSKGEQVFNDFFEKAIAMPYVGVARTKYLTDQLDRNGFGEDVIAKAIETTPLQAGITQKQLDKIARASINFETAKTTGLSTAAGVPGGVAMLGTVPADLSQYFAHVLRVAQKVAYLYGWDDFVDADKKMSEETRDTLILFLGVMSGVQMANEAIQKIALASAETVAKRITAKALTKTVYYPIVKKVGSLLGMQVTKETFGKTVGKAVPLIGGAVSGGLTLATFRPMCAKLRDELKLVAK